jgi:arylsulfatase A-like enzyme
MPSSPALPNILFLLSDQQRWDTLGCYGQSLDVTPHLDQMAAEGVRFEYAFTPQPVCGPARACLMTGRYASQNGSYRNGIPLRPGQDTIANLLSARGYETSYIGKWHLAGGIDFYEDHRKSTETYDDAPVPLQRRGGFKDTWLAADLLEFTSHGYGGHVFNAGMQRVDFPQGCYRADALTDFAIGHLRTRDRSRPFFLFISYLEPHHQNDTGRYEAPHGSSQRWQDFIAPGDLAGKKGNWRRDYADYLACIHSLDENAGRLRAELKRLGLSENTLIVYTSDHGNHFKTRNSEYKRSAHEASIRIPLILCGPGFCGGETCSELVTLLDLPPTLLAAAGAAVSGWMPGCALQPFVSGALLEERDILVQVSESTLGRALRTRRWKYSVCDPLEDGWQKPSSRRYVEEFLYDLEADPHEQHNLVRDPAHIQIRAELSERLLFKMKSICEPPAEILPAYHPLKFWFLKTLGTIKNTSWLYWKIVTQYLH